MPKESKAESNPSKDIKSSSQSLKSLRSQFLQAEAAQAKGHTQVYQQLKKQLVHYPLYPYLLAREYETNIDRLPLKTFQDFMELHYDSPLAEKLRELWLQSKAKQEDWPGFLKGYIPTQNISTQCQFLWAELQTRSDKKTVLEQTLPLWLSGKERPKACEAIFRQFEKSTLITQTLIWQKIKLAMQADNIKLARHLKHSLKREESALVDLWITVHNNPYLITQSKYFSSKHPAVLEIMAHAISQIADNSPSSALKIWQEIRGRYSFQEKQRGEVARAIALAFAAEKNPLAEQWLREVPDVYANHAVHEARMRLSLAKQDWRSMLHWISRLPETLSNHEAWQYWQARALEKMNRHTESQELLHKLAQTRSYYGFLASQKLEKPYYIADRKFNLDSNHLIDIARKAGVQRAKELYTLGREAKARAEWLLSTQHMDDKERHAAAALALHWGLPNWSILALSKANNKDDLGLRFPLVYQQPILKEAQSQQVDPAWIFAVTRQESAFIHNAQSNKGAMGLMQLMPATAQLIAKKHQLPLGKPSAALEPHKNIQLGTRYLRMMLDNYENHPILATAAYNAGPGRVKKWLPPIEMSADTWVETIPYKETREYVKNVLTYTIIYQQLLGHKTKQPKPLPGIPAARLASNSTSGSSASSKIKTSVKAKAKTKTLASKKSSRIRK